MTLFAPARFALRRVAAQGVRSTRGYSSSSGTYSRTGYRAATYGLGAAFLGGAGYLIGQNALSSIPTVHAESNISNSSNGKTFVPITPLSGDSSNRELTMRERMEIMIKQQQNEIVEALEQVDGCKFRRDEWERPAHGGGGISCVLQEGRVFEKAGVNVSVVNGTLPPAAVKQMRVNHKALRESDADEEDLRFFAAGLSMVLHPKNPMAPTVHLNYRYFETFDADGNTKSWWFGGGTDLTPSYLFEEDAVHFHKVIKEECDKHDKSYYPKFKKWCDEYFWVKHRGEARGIGGIFFDDLDDKDRDQLFNYAEGMLKAFLPGYLPIIERRKHMPYTLQQKEWQQLRRGRYVEFNLVHDRGTAFGLNTPGARVESILMSLPLTAEWKYMHEPEEGSPEAQMLEVLKNPRDWV